MFPPHANPDGDCVLRRLRNSEANEESHWPAGFERGIAHRLDIPTSGQILVGKSPEDLRWLRSLFQKKLLTKRYRFLTARTVPWSTHEVAHEIAHDRKHKKRMVVRRSPNTPHRGKWLHAKTRFVYIGAHANGLHCWEATMRTGVMHQIRIHAAIAGLALIGDKLYGGGTWDYERPSGASFALHHTGLSGPNLSPDPVDLPQWWPQPLP